MRILFRVPKLDCSRNGFASSLFTIPVLPKPWLVRLIPVSEDAVYLGRKVFAYIYQCHISHYKCEP